jgi:hypothetical protein
MNRLMAFLAGSSREARLEAALRRVVRAHALAMWANDCSDHATYESLANDRDDAIEAAGEVLGGAA